MNRMILAAFVAVFAATPAFAASDRTWVASNGSGSTCSRALPCATFQVAHDNTNAGGEINCLDSADFGSVAISKSISIICDDAPGRIMGPGVLNAIGINAASSDVVVLSGLDLNGNGSGSFGVAITGATGKVQIRNTVVQGFGAFGVNWAGSASSQLFIANSDIHDNSINVNFDATTAAASGLNAHMNNVRISNGSIGVQVNSSSTALGVNANLRDCVITGASTAGVLTGGTGYAVATVVNSLLTGNFGPALMAQGGSGTSVIRVGNSSILVNARGVQTSGVGQVRSYGDNNLDGNSVDGAFTAPVLAKK